MDLLDSIDRWGRDAPSRLAHVSGSSRLTYGGLVRRSDALAAHLVSSLPNDRSPVVVLGHKEPEMLVAFLGAVKSGHPYVPVDTALPPQRVERIVAAAGARLTLTPELVAARSDGPAPRPTPGLRPEDPYYIMFTSGSTGEPKGVVITLGCLTSFLEWMLAEHPFAARAETFLNQAPFSFDLSVMDLYLGLVTGGTVASLTRTDVVEPKRLYQMLAGAGLTVWCSTPSFALMCLAERSFAAGMLPQLRRFLFCGETLPPEVAGQLLDRFPEAAVWNTYGPTEATVATTSVRVDRDLLSRYPSLPIGFPRLGSRVLVLDEAGEPAPPGERGEIVIAGRHVSPGYLGRPDLTARAFFELDGERAYRTGDWGRVCDGMLFFEGRMDGQIKLHGYRVELGDVEANLRAVPGVREAIVLPVMKDGRCDALAAFLILAQRPEGSDFEVAYRLRAQLAERLPSYMVPRKVHVLETLPMTANGKADRRALAAGLV